MLKLRHTTSPQWIEVVLANFDTFLQDHAANERKVSHSALTLAIQHPHLEQLVGALIEVAQEELTHFRQVYDLLVQRGRRLGQDAPDPYMGALRRNLQKREAKAYLMDRLLLFAVVEARGCERFALVADALEPGALKTFYTELVRSEARHHGLYLRLARQYFTEAEIQARLDEWLDVEARVIAAQPVRPALH